MSIQAQFAYACAAMASFIGATLLWHIQPMMARALLPQYGGSAAVWTTALVFYQSALVVGYAYAHRVVRLGLKGLWIHVALLLLTAIIFPLNQSSPLDDAAHQVPALGILWSLLISIGGPYILLSATAPLVQAVSPNSTDRSSYRLFAWSNLGSIVGLLGYPFVVEPLLGVSLQQSLWFTSYLIFGLLLSVTLFLHRTGFSVPPVADADTNNRLQWLGLSALGVGLLMAISDAISADLTVTPLLWVLPLFCYLLSFVVSFGSPSLSARRFWVPAAWVASGVTVYLLFTGWRVHWGLQLALWCGVLFCGCMLCHGELVRRRPGPSQLTRFYLDISLGGAAAGALVAVVCPYLLPLRVEVHITVALTAWLAWRAWSDARRLSHPFQSLDALRMVFFVGFIGLVVSFALHLGKTTMGDTVLYRNFYGTLQVKRYPIPKKKGGLTHLLDGRISHGFQYGEPPHRDRPTAYFVPSTGIGRVLSKLKSPRRVIVLGLGVGTLSAYAEANDQFAFFEINPDVAVAAETQFEYLGRAQGEIVVRLGDGRLLMSTWRGEPVDLIAVDAFTGDAIPAHLITREAIDLYWSHLKDGGVLAVNVSNRHAHLWKVLQAHASQSGKKLARVRHTSPSPLGSYTSDWVLMVRHGKRLVELGLPTWQYNSEDDVLWTDDYAPLHPILKAL
jgi:hypothetical protein